MTFLVDGTLGGTFPSWTTATRPASPANTDWQQYQVWLSQGNTPLPPA